MSASRKTLPMTADEFLAWTETLTDDTRYELFDSEPVAMAPELISHNLVKGQVYLRLSQAIEAGRLPCRALVDGVGVRVGRRTMFIPDVLVDCGPPPPEARELNPLLVVEVGSPSTARYDAEQKLIGYFAVLSIRHYLIVSPQGRTIVHHERRADGVIETHLCGEGPVRLDPPGLVLGDIFPPETS